MINEKIITIDKTSHKMLYFILKNYFMDSTKLILIFGISLLIYFAFMCFGFFLKNKNLKAQNLKEEE